MKMILLPDGRRFNVDASGSVYYPQGTQVIYGIIGGELITYTGLVNADLICRQIDTFVASANSFLNLQYQISSITPTSFDITTATLTINGQGFSAATLGSIYFEDQPGGQDSNGYYHTCTFVSPTKLTTVYGGLGDSILDPAMIIYYRDSNGVTSNNISASNPSGTLITIP